MEQGFAFSEIDTSKPHPARLYDFYLGGKDNYAADRAAAKQVLRVAPEVRVMARENRAFLRRAVRFLAGEAGIDQIIDIGTGIPTAGNVHQVAEEIAPGTRVVYVDNDPIVHVHANALLTGTGATSIVLADLREPEVILAHPKVRELIDFSRPVALLLVAILHFITDAEDPAGILAAFGDALVPVVTSRFLTGPPTSTPRKPLARPPPCMNGRPLPWCCAAMPKSQRFSMVSAWLTLVWCRCLCGAPTASRPAPKTSPRSPSTAALGAATGRREPARQGGHYSRCSFRFSRRHAPWAQGAKFSACQGWSCVPVIKSAMRRVASARACGWRSARR